MSAPHNHVNHDPNRPTARCGGPYICGVCALEFMQSKVSPSVAAASMPHQGQVERADKDAEATLSPGLDERGTINRMTNAMGDAAVPGLPGRAPGPYIEAPWAAVDKCHSDLTRQLTESLGAGSRYHAEKVSFAIDALVRSLIRAMAEGGVNERKFFGY
jgi:hypothetical protein